MLEQRQSAPQTLSEGDRTAALDTMEATLQRLGQLVAERDDEVAALRNTVRKEVEERVQLQRTIAAYSR